MFAGTRSASTYVEKEQSREARENELLREGESANTFMERSLQDTVLMDTGVKSTAERCVEAMFDIQ